MKVEKTAGRVWCAVTAISIAAAGLSSCGRPHAPPGGTAARAAARGDSRAVRVALVESRSLEGGLTASGNLVSREEAAVNSDISGYRVAKVNFEQGAWVKAGQPLAELDDTLLRSQIEEAAAQAEQADFQAKNVQGLDNQGVLSAEQIQTRRITARMQDAALRDLKTRESHMIIRAPVSGFILERNVRPGDIASAATATPMFRMVRDGLVELNAEVNEADFGNIHSGDPVKVTLPNSAVVAGKVRLIDPLVDSTTKLGHVRIQLPVRPDLRPGGFARATFEGASVAQRTVPELSIRYDADGASVMVIGPDNRVTEVPVKTGRRSGGYVELLEGPSAGSRVLLGAASFVLPGDLVKPVNDLSPPAGR
jgi:HlyD family secretion protein